MGFQGDLDTFGLATIFQTLTANQQSGTLHVHDDKSERFLVFSEGAIRCVASGERRNVSLGEILVAGGKIDESILAEALRRQAEEHGPLGRILVEMGVCSREDIDDALRFQMEEEIYDLFTWKGAKFEFDENRSGDTLVGGDIRVSHVRVNTAGILLEAMRRIDEWERLSRILPSMEIVPRLEPVCRQPAFLDSLSPEEKRILGFIDGVNNIDAIRCKSCMGRYAVTQFLARLFSDGRCREASREEMLAAAEKAILQGDPPAAVAVYRRVLSLRPDDLQARQALAAALEAVDEPRAAAREWCLVGEALCAAHDFAGAVDACLTADRLQPGEVATMERLAALYVLAERPREAGRAWRALVRILEERGEKARALECVEGAITDLPEDLDLLRMRARLLLALGRNADAADAYERVALRLQERGDNGGAVAALRSVLQIDGGRRDLIARIRRLQFTVDEVRRRRTGVLLASLAAGLLLLVGLGMLVNELQARGRTRRALALATRLARDAAGLEPVTRQRRLAEAVDVLTRAKPVFSIISEPEASRRRELARLRLRLAAAGRAKSELEREQQRVFNAWKRLRDQDTPEAGKARAAFRALLEYTPATAVVRRAAKAAAAWQRHESSVKEKLAAILARVGDKGLPPSRRLDALALLAKKYPGSLHRRFPNGVLGLTVPVHVSAHSNTGFALAARIVIGGRAWSRRTPCVAEIPCDPGVVVQLQHPGFGGRGGLTVLKRDVVARRSYAVELERAARWRARLGGRITGAPMFADQGRLVLAATLDGHIAAMDVLSGEVRWPRPAATVLVPGAYHAPLVVTRRRVYALDQGGGLACLGVPTGRLLWPLRDERRPLRGQLPVAIRAVRLARDKAAGDRERTTLLVTAQGDSPLFAVSGDSGRLLWPVGEGARELRRKISRVLAGPVPLSRQRGLLLFDDRGRLHLLLEDGTYGGGTQLVSGKVIGYPLLLVQKQGEIRLLAAVMGEGVCCFTGNESRPLRLAPAWSNSAFRAEEISAPWLVVGMHAFIGCASGRVARLDLATGRVQAGWDLKTLPGPVVGPMAVCGRHLLFTCAAARDRPAALLAVHLGSERMQGPIWRFDLGRGPLPTGVRVHTRPGSTPDVLVTAAGSLVFCLENDAP